MIVAKAVEAVKAAIDVCNAVSKGDWFNGRADPDWWNMNFIIAARAGYAGAPEYLLRELDMWFEEKDMVIPYHSIYVAVAPIVQWHRAQGGLG